MPKAKVVVKPALTAQERRDILDELGKELALKRDEAVKARAATGIEDTWRALEEAYLGIDDYNRAEFTNAKWAKPMSIEGPITRVRADNTDVRSTAFIRLTARYVDAAAARLGDILFPIDDKAFSLKAMPDPEMIDFKGDHEQMEHPNGMPMMRNPRPDEQPADPTGAPPNLGSKPAPVPMSKNDWYTIQMSKSQEAADCAENRIQRWLLMSKYPAEGRKVVHDGARIGVGILKGPVPRMDRATAAVREGNTLTVKMREARVPGVQWIDPWNFFPSGSCGENIHSGEYTVERDFMTARVIEDLLDERDLNGRPAYLPYAIRKVLKEGPDKSFLEGRNPFQKDDYVNDMTRFTVYYYTGYVKREYVEAVKLGGLETLDPAADKVPVVIMLINDTVVKVGMNPLDSGAFPYKVFSWSRRAGHWAGIGVGEQVATPQRIVNGATRAMLNNAGKSAGSQIVIDREAIEPADGVWTMTPDKVWYMTGEGQSEPDVRKAFMFVQVPNVGAELMRVNEYAFKLAEELSNIPLQQQGHESDNQPETFGQAEILNTNSKTLLRSIAYIWDDNVTEPLISDMYEWLLLDDSVPAHEKGDFEINAQGSIALVERAIQEQTLQVWEQMAQDPGYGINKRRLFTEIARSKRMDPRKVQNTPEEQAKIDSQPPQPPVQVAVAQLRAQSAAQIQQGKSQTTLQAEQMRAQAALQQTQMELQHEAQQDQAAGQPAHVVQAEARLREAQLRAETAKAIESNRGQTELIYAQTEAQMARDNAAARLEELQIKREIELLKYANQRQLSLDKVKADLAITSMNNATKVQLAAADQALTSAEARHDRTHDLVKHHSQLQADAVDAAQERSHDMEKHTTQLDAMKSDEGSDEPAA